MPQGLTLVLKNPTTLKISDSAFDNVLCQEVTGQYFFKMTGWYLWLCNVCTLGSGRHPYRYFVRMQNPTLKHLPVDENACLVEKQ